MKTTFVACPEHADCIAEAHFIPTDDVRRGGGTIVPSPSWLSERVGAMTFEGMSLVSLSHSRTGGEPVGFAMESRLRTIERDVSHFLGVKVAAEKAIKEATDRTLESLRAQVKSAEAGMRLVASEAAGQMASARLVMDAKASEVATAAQDAVEHRDTLKTALKELQLEVKILRAILEASLER